MAPTAPLASETTNPPERDSAQSKSWGNATLLRSTVWSIAGLSAPLLVGIITIPKLVRDLGADRFGILSFAWLAIGYLGLFDLGLGRALTQLIASREEKPGDPSVLPMARAALLLMAVLGTVGAFASFALTPWIVTRAMKMPAALHEETIRAFYVLAASLPLVVLTAGLKGMLQARLRFDLISMIAVPMGVLNFVGPWAALFFGGNLVDIVGVLVGNRALSFIAHLWFCLRLFPGLTKQLRPEPGSIRRLLALGTWMTLGNLIGPLTMYLDRPIIGALLSVSAVTYYSVPFEMISKILIVSGAVGSVMFPAFSAAFSQDPAHAAKLYLRWLKYLFIALYPAAVIALVCAKPGLSIWLGTAFAANSFLALQVLVAGFFLLGIEGIPFALIQAMGRPDIPAKLNMIELPFYVMALWLLTTTYGIVGTAIAFSLRAAVDAAVLLLVANRLLPGVRLDMGSLKYLGVSAALAASLAWIEIPLGARLLLLTFLLVVHARVFWVYLLDRADRAAVASLR